MEASLFKLVAAGLCILLVVDVVCLVAVDWIQFLLPMRGMKYLWAARDGVVFGLFTPQVLLAATYSSLGDGSGLKRILYSMLVVTMFTLTLRVFTRWWFATAPNDSASILLLVVLYFCLIQIPFWILRVCSGWRITLRPGTVHERMRFSVIQMIGWSTFLSVPLCIVASLGELGDTEVIVYITLWPLALAALAIGAIYISLVVESVSKCIAAASILSGATVTIEVCLIRALGGGDNEAVTAIIANILGLFLFLFYLRVARSVGYRLQPFHMNIVGRPQAEGVPGR